MIPELVPQQAVVQHKVLWSPRGIQELGISSGQHSLQQQCQLCSQRGTLRGWQSPCWPQEAVHCPAPAQLTANREQNMLVEEGALKAFPSGHSCRSCTGWSHQTRQLWNLPSFLQAAASDRHLASGSSRVRALQKATGSESSAGAVCSVCFLCELCIHCS